MRFDNIFSSGAVFPHGKTILIYGTGDGTGTVEFAGQVNTVVCEDGRWLTQFPAMEYGGPYTLKLESSGASVILDDIYVGEVYLCSGQSNIELKLRDTNTSPDDHRSNDMLRYFSVDKITSNGLFSPEDGWIKADKDTVHEWSAKGYLTGREIAETKNIAVGIIICAQGASVIESWVPKGTFEAIGIDIPINEKAIGHRKPEYLKWYEKQLRQVFPDRLNGVIWYQGESDAVGRECDVYHTELMTLINKWRTDFDDAELPFYVICLHDYFPDEPYRDNEGWRKIQRAQKMVPEMTEGVVTVECADICETDNIHPPTKTILSHRLADAIMSGDKRSEKIIKAKNT